MCIPPLESLPLLVTSSIKVYYHYLSFFTYTSLSGQLQVNIRTPPGVYFTYVRLDRSSVIGIVDKKVDRVFALREGPWLFGIDWRYLKYVFMVINTLGRFVLLNSGNST